MFGSTTIAARLTAAPTLRETPQGKAVTTLRVAVDDHRLGEESPRFVDVDQWEDAAQHAVEHLVQGQQVTAEGLLYVDAYLKDGAPQAGWNLRRARVEWGSRPLAARGAAAAERAAR